MLQANRVRAILSCLLALVAARTAAAQEEPETEATPPPPILSSVDTVVKRILDEGQDAPCKPGADEQVPCFPIKVEKKAPDASVAESLRDLGSTTAPVPGRPPSADELARYRPGSASPTANVVSLDPICAAKSLVKKIKGQNDVYYVYRVREPAGERMALYDHPLDPKQFWSVPGISYEFLGRFDGECEAIAAYRRAVRTGTAAAR